MIPLFGLANFAVFKLRRGCAGGLSPFSVVIARGRHLFPFRTEQLSPSAPMVLGPRGPGRVGRRRFIQLPRAVRFRRPAVVVQGFGGVSRRGARSVGAEEAPALYPSS